MTFHENKLNLFVSFFIYLSHHKTTYPWLQACRKTTHIFYYSKTTTTTTPASATTVRDRQQQQRDGKTRLYLKTIKWNVDEWQMIHHVASRCAVSLDPTLIGPQPTHCCCRCWWYNSINNFNRCCCCCWNIGYWRNEWLLLNFKIKRW